MILGFAEAGSLFWLTLSDSITKAGWQKHLLDRAFSTLCRGGELTKLAGTSEVLATRGIMQGD